MILRRLTANLRAQNWTAIAIELVVVILGVFIGTQVSNWNADRLERRQTQRMLVQLKPELTAMSTFFANARGYYATTAAYAETAFAGWRRDPRVSDEQFVIAAYQASQIVGYGANGQNWATIFGADQLQNIDDIELRRGVASFMSGNIDTIDRGAVMTSYRENVRRVIPEAVQADIREHCGDRLDPAKTAVLGLPRTCRLGLAPGVAAAAATALRARPQLVEDLRGHLAAVAVLLSDMQAYDALAHDLSRRIED